MLWGSVNDPVALYYPRLKLCLVRLVGDDPKLVTLVLAHLRKEFDRLLTRDLQFRM